MSLQTSWMLMWSGDAAQDGGAYAFHTEGEPKKEARNQHEVPGEQLLGVKRIEGNAEARMTPIGKARAVVAGRPT